MSDETPTIEDYRELWSRELQKRTLLEERIQELQKAINSLARRCCSQSEVMTIQAEFFAAPPICARHKDWTKIRDAFIEKHPECAVCGSAAFPHAHHVLPVHLYPEYELNPDNLVTLCAARCHYLFGHLCDWMSYNKYVLEDARDWRIKIDRRPKNGKT